ncbi:MAG: hypothetical protein PVF83_03530 [Anaerolineales bacterium]
MKHLIRPFDIQDFKALHRLRHRGLFLDSIPTLTWGKALVPLGAMLIPLSAAMGVCTSVFDDVLGDSEKIFAQVSHTIGSPYARFTFVTPDEAIDSPNFSPLLEYLIRWVGAREARQLIAEVDEKAETFEVLRREHFSIYARQRIWRLTDIKGGSGERVGWRQVFSKDEFNVRKLYHAIVPTLVQQVEPSPWDRGGGWAFYRSGEMLGYAEVFSGFKGVWVQPFIHPETKEVEQLLTGLLKCFNPRKSRPVYLCLRSYQSWLAHPLETAGAEVSGSQAVMVRHLAVPIKKAALAPIPQINGGTEPTTSYIKKTLQNGENGS